MLFSVVELISEYTFNLLAQYRVTEIRAEINATQKDIGLKKKVCVMESCTLGFTAHPE